jgi:endonuclease/exonuclease/phosphatase family metal-dependent hydrolase
MKFMVYNIRYGTGGHHWSPLGGYLSQTHNKLGEIIDFIRPYNPDVIGLIEVDSGSYRSQRKNQAEIIASELGHYHCWRSKYTEGGLSSRIPILNKQSNAFLSRDSINEEKFHYFNQGMKRLVIELELDNMVFFLVHLALSFRVRQLQLLELYRLIKTSKKPTVIAGDFNALWGEHEIELFLGASGFLSANTQSLPTFPSKKPTRHLDFILHSPDIKTLGLEVPQTVLSDHLPLIWDFEITG